MFYLFIHSYWATGRWPYSRCVTSIKQASCCSSRLWNEDKSYLHRLCQSKLPNLTSQYCYVIYAFIPWIIIITLNATADHSVEISKQNILISTDELWVTNNNKIAWISSAQNHTLMKRANNRISTKVLVFETHTTGNCGCRDTCTILYQLVSDFTLLFIHVTYSWYIERCSRRALTTGCGWLFGVTIDYVVCARWADVASTPCVRRKRSVYVRVVSFLRYSLPKIVDLVCEHREVSVAAQWRLMRMESIVCKTSVYASRLHVKSAAT